MSLEHERKTVAAMVELYCRGRHGGSDGLCAGCRELLEYADARLARCPFQDDKPTCRQCPVHCYRQPMRERITEVMRWAGPRMVWHHPILAARHMMRGNGSRRAR